MKICPNAYYNFKKDNKAGYRLRKNAIQTEMLNIYHEHSGNPGYRMMRVYLARKGINLSSTTTLKYMQELKISSTLLRKKPVYKKGEIYKKYKDHLKQNFYAEKKNQKWCTDFTYVYIEDGKTRYNCSIIDLYDRSAVATLNSKRMDAELAINTLKTALERNGYPKDLLLHSDQGSQYTSRAFTEYCEEHSVIQSMSRAGCPYDNAPMERFYETFKTEFLNKHRFLSDEDLNKATNDYVYGFYNHVRPHSANNYMTPFEKRNHNI